MEGADTATLAAGLGSAMAANQQSMGKGRAAESHSQRLGGFQNLARHTLDRFALQHGSLAQDLVGFVFLEPTRIHECTRVFVNDGALTRGVQL